MRTCILFRASRGGLFLIGWFLPIALAGQSIGKAPAFTVSYGEADTTADWKGILKHSRFLESAARPLNGRVALRRSITLELASCPLPNAVFDTRTRHAKVCYELAEEIYEQLYTYDADYATRHGKELSDSSVSEIVENTKAALRFFLFHEIAHGIISTFDIPVTGKEEDAADQLAIILLERVYGAELGGVFVEAGGLAFALFAQEESVDKSSLTDVHALAAQRSANISCWSVATDKIGVIRSNSVTVLSVDRAAQCPAEWAKIRASWQQLLGDSSR